MRRTKEDADKTRQALLSAALRVFSRDGYAVSKIDEIADEAGVTRGALYHHFGGKAALYNALVDEISGRVLRVVNDAVEEGGSTLDVFRRVFVRSVSYVAKDPEWEAVNRLVIHSSHRDPRVKKGDVQRFEARKQSLEQTAQGVRDGIKEGEIRSDVDPESVARHFMSLQHGLLSLWIADPKGFDLAVEAERAADLFIRGIEAR